MNTSELEELEKYHAHMAKISESHATHHKKMLRGYRDRRRKLKRTIDEHRSKIVTDKILRGLKSEQTS